MRKGISVKKLRQANQSPAGAKIQVGYGTVRVIPRLVAELSLLVTIT